LIPNSACSSADSHALDTRRLFQQATNFSFQRAIIEIHVRNLMIGDGERPAGATVQDFQP
jgi:hypothetical protein